MVGINSIRELYDPKSDYLDTDNLITRVEIYTQNEVLTYSYNLSYQIPKDRVLNACFGSQLLYGSSANENCSPFNKELVLQNNTWDFYDGGLYYATCNPDTGLLDPNIHRTIGGTSYSHSLPWWAKNEYTPDGILSTKASDPEQVSNVEKVFYFKVGIPED